MDTPTPSLLNRIKEFTATLRELVIVVVIALLFLNPGLINSTLTKAGFVSADFGMFQWQRQLEEANAKLKTAQQNVVNVERELTAVKHDLTRITQRPEISPAVREQVTSLTTRIDTSQQKTAAVTRELSDTIKNQDRLVTELRRVRPAP